MKVSLKIRRLRDVQLPAFQTQGSAGMDLRAVLDSPIHLNSGERKLIPTGLAVEIPPGFEGQVRPRSGLALRYGLSILNSPGTIDSDYRGEIGVIVINLGRDKVSINSGDRIAQLIISPVVQVDIIEVDEIKDTKRGRGGFGHTGKN